MPPLKARSFFVALVVAAGLLIAHRIVPVGYVARPIRVTITQNRVPVASLDAPRDPLFVANAHVSTVDFLDGTSFEHRLFGNFHLTQDFFAELSTTMSVIVPGRYVFGVAADDGFRLEVGDRMLGQTTAPQSYSEQEFTTDLGVGTFAYRLLYFQGQARLGLQAFYRRADEERRYLIGEDSPFITFSAPEPGAAGKR